MKAAAPAHAGAATAMMAHEGTGGGGGCPAVAIMVGRQRTKQLSRWVESGGMDRKSDG